MKGYLQYFTFAACAHSNSLPGSWSLDSASSRDLSNPLNILEVCCRWTGPDGEDAYASCNRDPGAIKSVRMTFNASYSIYHNGVCKGALSSYSYTATEGDVDVIRAE